MHYRTPIESIKQKNTATQGRSLEQPMAIAKISTVWKVPKYGVIFLVCIFLYFSWCASQLKSGSQIRVQGNTDVCHVTFVKRHALNSRKVTLQRTVEVKGLISCLLRHRKICLVFLYLVEELLVEKLYVPIFQLLLSTVQFVPSYSRAIVYYCTFKETINVEGFVIQFYLSSCDIFRLNTDMYSLNLRIQSEYRKIRTRNKSLLGHFLHSEAFSVSLNMI